MGRVWALWGRGCFRSRRIGCRGMLGWYDNPIQILTRNIQWENAFIHPVGSYKIFQLSDAQLQAFTEFGSQDAKFTTPGSSPPFPFKTERWTRRVHEDESMSLHIYRDTHERKPKTNTSDRKLCPRVRLEDEAHLLDVINLMRANGGKLPPDFPQCQHFGSDSRSGQWLSAILFKKIKSIHTAWEGQHSIEFSLKVHAKEVNGLTQRNWLCTQKACHHTSSAIHFIQNKNKFSADAVAIGFKNLVPDCHAQNGLH